MPIIAKVDRRSTKTRILIAGIYTLLTAGAVTMLYPFLLMVAGSTKSGVDLPNNVVIPRFLRDDAELYRKHIEGLFNESFDQMQMAYQNDAASFMVLEPPEAVNEKLVDEWEAFLEESPPGIHSYTVGYVRCPVSRGVLPHVLRNFKAQLVEQFDNDVLEMNRVLGTEFVNWNAFIVLPEDFTLRRNTPGTGAFDEAFREYKQTVPIDERTYFSIEGFFKAQFLKSEYTEKLEEYNDKHGTTYESWDDIHLTERVPEREVERKDWLTFVGTILNLLWIRVDESATPSYQRFLEAKYHTVERLNKIHETSYASFADVELAEEPPAEGLPMSDFASFLEGWVDPDTGETHQIPAEMIRLHTLDFMFRDHLRSKYDTVRACNAALGTSYISWLSALPPQDQWHYRAFNQKRSWLKREFAGRNYVTVADYIVRHGRGILNTVIYCTLAILAALIVNPLAAYALSRFKPTWSYKALLFLMMTMAFPPMVTQIPVFLMLRQLHLLNTFWALVLPGLANGYMIFLLKGFFDSLPQELYESASVDGAGELRIFWQITIRLSQPILAVIALNAFTAAYSNFMMALLICQDERMWTLMPWLYQLQQRSGQGVVFASLLIAAIPTFLVFAFCQNIIMRGIVVPVEK